MHIETENLNKRFGGVIALEEVSLEFPSATVTAIIGPNGAGKTTLFNVLTGFLKPDSGSVLLIEDNNDGFNPARTDLLGLAPHEVARKGVGVLFQDVRVFNKLSALENVAVGVKDQVGEKPAVSLFSQGRMRQQEAQVLDRARHLLEYVGLSENAHLLANQLSYGQQKLVAIARLLAGDAHVLLLDEPTSGVHPDMIDKLLDLIQKLADDDGRAVIMIEHNLNVVKRIGEWVYLMANGRVEVFGKPNEVLHDRLLLECFPTL